MGRSRHLSKSCSPAPPWTLEAATATERSRRSTSQRSRDGEVCRPRRREGSKAMAQAARGRPPEAAARKLEQHSRGLTFENSFIIADEASNESWKKLEGLCAWVTDNSKLVIIGDPAQSDRHLANWQGSSDEVQPCSVLETLAEELEHRAGPTLRVVRFDRQRQCSRPHSARPYLHLPRTRKPARAACAATITGSGARSAAACAHHILRAGRAGDRCAQNGIGGRPGTPIWIRFHSRSKPYCREGAYEQGSRTASRKPTTRPPAAAASVRQRRCGGLVASPLHRPFRAAPWDA